jgi:hypothetical protein
LGEVVARYLILGMGIELWALAVASGCPSGRDSGQERLRWDERPGITGVRGCVF